jgi:hypothetical protein
VESTVSRFLGQQDGGALALKTYGHLRDDHAANMASRVTFKTTTTTLKPANAI